ncbi:Alcohol dehydrogenase 4 [Cyphellophora attinorum]|uniref:Alcohol dehydrogenase 4 n=1 Tax=Cyphellophora attinorum TaxID=1664694 RepID=A0A0N1NZH0_9EURO|nr:Alcohol dehydrogenase 4 [Phialophora attinorum]KPI38744.1 Alcohol dehydrogenase 4 [Phialophora attinorum]
MTAVLATADSFHPAFPDRSVPNIAYGSSSFSQLCAQHVSRTLGCRRAYIIASTSLAKNTPHLTNLVSTLEQSGITVVRARTGFSPHTKWDQVIACSADARPLRPDCIITLGGGSLTDAAKVICWMLAQPSSIDSISGLETMSEHGYPETFNHNLNPPTVKHVAIPTTLSGGEYQSISGMTRTDITNGESVQRKVLFSPPEANPTLVILSPSLTLTTPLHTWLSTGVRALDHCVETLCSLLSNPKGDASAVEGLKLLIPGLLGTRADPEGPEARFQCMLGVIQAMSAVGTGVPMGASHAIGHQLGPLGVGHGETSCVLLPSVCKWNHKVGANVERQERARELLLKIDAVVDVLTKADGKGKERDLGDILDIVIRALGMPRSLRDVGVGREQLDMLARNSLKDHWIMTNPKPIDQKEWVMEILEMAF